MDRSTRRFSPALVISCVALLFALTGTGIAAVSAALPRNSVGPLQLKANAVTNPKLRNAAVTQAKLANNAVTSAKVLNGSLIANDFAPGQIPTGPTGPAGPAGPAGAPGASGYQIVEVDSPSDSNPTKQFTANCPSGKRVVGGGSQISGDGKQYVADNGSYPSGSGAGFTAEAQEVIATPQNWQLKVYAICAAVTT